MTEKPIRYDRVPLDDTSGAGGSRDARGQPVTVATTQAIHAQLQTELIMIEYAQQAVVVAHSIKMSSQSLPACGRASIGIC